jgi:hypothetical protein
MCHREWRRLDERAEERRGERLWDLFYRETEEPAPPMPVADRDAAPEPDHEEALTGVARAANHRH